MVYISQFLTEYSNIRTFVDPKNNKSKEVELFRCMDTTPKNPEGNVEVKVYAFDLRANWR
jgi:hypothetical protein